MINKYIRRVLFHRSSAFIHDILWVPISLLLSYWLRFNLHSIPDEFVVSLLRLIIIAIPIFTIIFWNVGLYRGIWKFASIQDAVRILKAVFLGTLIFCLLESIFFRLVGVPRSVFFMFPLLLTTGLSGPRLCYRWLKYRQIDFSETEGKRTLIVGAGHAGELLLRDLIHNRHEYHPIALIDDDPKKHNREIHGVRVYGGVADLTKVVRTLDIELVLLAIPSATADNVKRLVHECVKVGVECRTLPTLAELTGRQLEIEQIRPVTLEDLLGREIIELDRYLISECLVNKSVLITGAGGSIGSELCRQVAREKPSRLVLFDAGEFNLYSIDNELRNLFPQIEIITVLGDIKDKDRVKWVFRKFSPQVVFHAAAYKHVPMLELNPAEGVQNNVIGTKVVADAADQYQSEMFVLVSTDKAVNPGNVMGATKRIAEIYCQNISTRSKTKFITTRFGNVLGSAGSVVPLFEKQIKNGGPVTVTHREIRRYFMTIPESVSLILQAGAMGAGGEIFVLDMGDPVLIKDLAEQMIRLSGYEPGVDIEIDYIGLRPGEKLFEEIFHERENLKGTSHSKLLLAQSRQFDWNWLLHEVESLKKASTSRNVEKIIYHLRSVVPEYSGLHVSDRKQKEVAPKLRVVEK